MDCIINYVGGHVMSKAVMNFSLPVPNMLHICDSLGPGTILLRAYSVTPFEKVENIWTIWLDFGGFQIL